MRFGHDITGGVNAAIALVNTAPPAADPDELTDLASLDAFLHEHAFRHAHPPDAADLDALREVRTRLTAVLDAGSMDQAAARVNQMIADSRPTPRMTNHDGLDWHLDFHTPGAPLHHHVGVELAMSVATLMVSSGHGRIRRCVAPDCHRYLADLSRNGSRRYCPGRNCGNRIAVRAYRTRQRRS